MKTAEEILKALSAPFTKQVGDKQIPDLKWLPTSAVSGGKKMMCTAYITRAQVIDRLNEVMGVDGWMSRLELQVDKTQICVLSLKINGEWVDRSDIGTQSKTEGEKGAASDALKRAATNFGIGAYIYKLPAKFVDAKAGTNGKPAPCAKDGKILYANQLHDYLNGMSTAQGYLAELLRYMPELFGREDVKVLWNDLKTL